MSEEHLIQRTGVVIYAFFLLFCLCIYMAVRWIISRPICTSPHSCRSHHLVQPHDIRDRGMTAFLEKVKLRKMHFFPHLALFSFDKHSLVTNFCGCIHFKDRKGLLALSTLASQAELKQARILHMAQLVKVSSILALELNPVAKINNVYFSFFL